MPLAARLLVALGAAALGACTPFALSPPARTFPLESPATLEENQVSIQATGGYSQGHGVESGGGSVRARFGVVEHLEAQLEGTYAYIDYDDERQPHLGAGRVGLKVAPIEHVSLVAGLGVGTHAYGSFAVPDAGIIVGYENRYIVPWTALRGFVSLPLDVRRVVLTREGDDGMPETFILVPPNTAGWQLSTGFRIPIVISHEERDTDGDGLADETHESRVDLLGGIAMLQLYGLDGQNSAGLFQFETGIEFVLDP